MADNCGTCRDWGGPETEIYRRGWRRLCKRWGTYQERAYRCKAWRPALKPPAGEKPNV